MENNPDRMGLALLSFTNIDHISKDSDVFKKLSKLALDNLEILPEEDTNHTINLQVLRGLGRKGLLDWNNFLSREDSLNIEDQLTVEYEESLHRSVEHSGQRLGMEKSPFLMSMNDERKKYVEESESLYLDNVSENNLNKYFGSSDLNFNFAKIDGIKIRSSLGTKTVEDSLDRFSSKSRMNESDACHMPRRDFRFNFHMDQNYNNRKNKINLLARIFAKAQIEGLPISSKTTMRDLKYYEKGYINRHMIYADVETAKQIIGYIKEISPEILKEDGGQVEYRESEFCGYLDIFKEDGIFIRTTHEVDCDEGSKEIILSNLNQIIPSE